MNNGYRPLPVVLYRVWELVERNGSRQTILGRYTSLYEAQQARRAASAQPGRKVYVRPVWR